STPTRLPRWGPRPGGVAPPSNTPGIATPPRKPRAAGAPVLSRPPAFAGPPCSRELRRDLGADLKVRTTLRFVPFVSLVFNRMPRQGVFMAVGGLGFLV